MLSTDDTRRGHSHRDRNEFFIFGVEGDVIFSYSTTREGGREGGEEGEQEEEQGRKKRMFAGDMSSS